MEDMYLSGGPAESSELSFLFQVVTFTCWRTYTSRFLESKVPSILPELQSFSVTPAKGYPPKPTRIQGESRIWQNDVATLECPR